MKARFTQKLSITIDPELYRKMEIVIDEFGGSFSELIRECVNNDLPKLIDRKRKAIKRQKPLL